MWLIHLDTLVQETLEMTDKCQKELRVAKAEANKHAAALKSAELKVNEMNTQMDRMCGEAIEVPAWGSKCF